MKSIIVGIYFATIVFSAAGLPGVSAVAIETAQETKRKTKTRRLRRATNVLKVDGIEDAYRKKEQAAAIESINRILSRSDDDEEKTGSNNNDKRQLVAVGAMEDTIAEINNKDALQESDVLYLMTHVLHEPTHRNFYSYSMPPSPVS